MHFDYPAAERVDIVDRYHDTDVPDPYRWLEDPTDPRTVAFAEAQNALTRDYLDSLPSRAIVEEKARRLWAVPRAGAPRERSGVRVRSRHDGVQQQPVLLVQGRDGEERVLVDPNEMAEDGTTAIVVWSLSPDGRHVAFSVAEGGSDWQRIRIRRTDDGTDLDEVLEYVKFSEIAWHDDGFFYTRFPEQDRSEVGVSLDPRVVYHRLGTDQRDDVEWFHNADRPDLLYSASVSDGGTWLVLTEHSGTSLHNGLLVRELRDGSEWVRIRELGVALWDFVDLVDGRFLVHTDLDAPNGRLVAIDPGRPEGSVEIIPEEPASMLDTVGWFGGAIVTRRLDDASHVVAIHDRDGSRRSVIELPAAGTVSEWDGAASEGAFHLQFQSFAHPPTALCHRDGSTTVVDGAPARTDVVVERHRVPSTDGAAVGLFLVRLEGAPPGPTEVYGYGGFDLAVTPMFDTARLAFLEAGGAAAITNLRGGSELGEDWHRQGMLGDKQQVFDDFIACARYLKDEGLATTVGGRGRSNGGLLTAATVLQAPDAFDAVVSTVPVTDMLRYQHFTAGRYWTVEYGDAADPDAFEWLIRYSPYHRAADAPSLPPLLVTTALGDDRVVPMHSFKFIAAVQHAAGGGSDVPYLCRVASRAGHGLGTPTSFLIDEAADVYGFLLHHLS